MSAYIVSLTQEMFNNMVQTTKKLEQENEELKNRLKLCDEMKNISKQIEDLGNKLDMYKSNKDNLKNIEDHSRTSNNISV
jgi:hypothetical protein